MPKRKTAPSLRFFYKSNRLQQLRGFCKVVELGSVSRAAVALRLSQSAVSLQIRGLAEDLHRDLFVRRGKHLRVTADGQLLYDLARPHVHGLQHLSESFLERADEREAQRLSIAANSTSLNFLLPGLVKAICTANPELSVQIHYAEQQEAVEKILDGSVPAALLPRREHLPFPRSVEFTPIYRFHPTLITLKDHPLCGRKRLRIRDIAAHELSFPAEDLQVIPNLHESFRRAGSRRLRVEFVNWETTRKYIEAGLVISISSDVILGPRDTLVGTPLRHLFPDVEYGLLTARGVEPQERVGELLEIARADARRRKRATSGVRSPESDG